MTRDQQSSSLSSRELADKMRTQYQKVRKGCDILLREVAVVPRDDYQKWFDAISREFTALHAHFHEHMALEEAGGYMSPIIEQRPRLSDEVDELYKQHQEIRDILDDIHEEIQKLDSNNKTMIADCSARIRNIVLYILSHEEQENRLFNHVFTLDIGTKD